MLVCRNMEMTPEAMEAIQELYGELRQEADNLSLPITVRSLETIIRLSTAAAVARMSDEGVQQVPAHAMHVSFEIVSQLAVVVCRAATAQICHSRSMLGLCDL